MLYTIFPTQWGFFGLAGRGAGVMRASLPLPDRTAACEHLLAGAVRAHEDPALFVDLQSRIKAYFEGRAVEFSDVAVDLDGLGEFSCKVLAACRKVGLGQTVTYGDLACTIARPAAARAVGGALGRNPVPLIIPCHRIVCSTGRLGGFSAPGGIAYKDRLLRHERDMRHRSHT